MTLHHAGAPALTPLLHTPRLQPPAPALVAGLPTSSQVFCRLYLAMNDSRSPWTSSLGPARERSFFRAGDISGHHEARTGVAHGAFGVGWLRNRQRWLRSSSSTAFHALSR